MTRLMTLPAGQTRRYTAPNRQGKTRSKFTSRTKNSEAEGNKSKIRLQRTSPKQI
jgi:hypothetical protein